MLNLSSLTPLSSSPPPGKFSAFQLANKKSSGAQAMLPVKGRKAERQWGVRTCSRRAISQECMATVRVPCPSCQNAVSYPVSDPRLTQTRALGLAPFQKHIGSL